jgi:hypothetical protein
MIENGRGNPAVFFWFFAPLRGALCCKDSRSVSTTLPGWSA